MDAIDTQLVVAEFEEIRLEVRYHEGRATIGDVERAIRWVNDLRRLADQHEISGTLPWPALRASAVAGH